MKLVLPKTHLLHLLPYLQDLGLLIPVTHLLLYMLNLHGYGASFPVTHLLYMYLHGYGASGNCDSPVVMHVMSAWLWGKCYL